MNIRELRKRKGITQKELAHAVQISSSVLSRYENGEIIPSQDRLNAIADYLDFPRESLKAAQQSSITQVIDDTIYQVSYDEDLNADRYIIVDTPVLIETLRLRSKSKCELCGQEAPFINTDGTPYLELHHIVPLLRGGQPTPDNSVLLCVNCHNKIHRLGNPSDLEKLKSVTIQSK